MKETSADIELFGQRLVWPCHPIAVAYCIVNEFDSLDDAIKWQKGNQANNAINSPRIPGTIQSIMIAIEFFHKLRSGQDIVSLYEQIDKDWSDIDGPFEWDDTWGPMGQEQANSIKELLKAYSDWWK